MKKDSIWMAWAVKNSVNAIVWAALAVIFHRWWIALFMLISMSSLETKSEPASTCWCDICGAQFPFRGKYEDLIKKKQELRWVSRIVDGKRIDVCPECQRKEAAGE